MHVGGEERFRCGRAEQSQSVHHLSPGEAVGVFSVIIPASFHRSDECASSE